jgi:hypothetical protein
LESFDELTVKCEGDFALGGGMIDELQTGDGEFVPQSKSAAWYLFV